MIRRLTLVFFVAFFIFSAATFFCSGNGIVISESKKMSKEEKKEKKRLERERKKRENAEKNRLKREQKKERKLKQKTEESKKSDEKKVEKKAEKERKRQEREEKKNINKEKAAKKQEEKKQSLWNRMFNKEQKNKARAENLKIKASEKEIKHANAAKLKEERYLSALERKKLADEKRKIRNEKIKVEKDIEKIEHERLVLINKIDRRKEAIQDYVQGYYVDLYRRPAWPFEMYFAEQKDIFQVEMKYDYATDAYNSKGSTTDLARFELGDRCFEFQDLLLAVKLANKGILKSNFDNKNLAARFLFDTYYNKKLNFLGESNEFDITLDFARYVFGKNALLGIKVPFGYRSHRLKLSSDIDPFDPAHLVLGSVDENINLPLQTMLEEMLNYVIEPKHLHYLPKTSITGIGDISTFLNFQFKTRYVDRFIVGVNVLWPTAKEADYHKIWAPSLGNDFTKISLFMSTLFNHQKNYFNPHVFLKGTYQVPGHKDRRVPKYISHTKDIADSLHPDVAHGDLVAFRNATEQQTTGITRFFKELDTTVPMFADCVKAVYIRPGCEIELQLGNIWEKFIFRRAFLDVFYNFRAKWRDHISNSDLPRDEWNPDVLKYQTNQIEHKIALDFTYQIDAKARVQAGFNYAFAGINIPVTLEGALTVNVEF